MSEKIDELISELIDRAKDVTSAYEWGTGIKESERILEEVRNALRDELARRDEQIAELEAMVNPASFKKFLIGQIKDPELAKEYAKACIQDDTYKELLARRDEIITRLKEDAERLADIADMFGDDAIAILEHRALMKELE